jgi:hypothetical protein
MSQVTEIVQFYKKNSNNEEEWANKRHKIIQDFKH